MAKTCIICGNPAGSGEHVFPAVLGGRRVNNGIYCDKHNNGFSPQAAIIGEQLRPINALLAVRPDRKKKSEPLEYTSPSGEKLVIFDGRVERAQPGNSNSDDAQHIHLSFGTEEGLKAPAYIALTFFAAHFQDHARKPGLKPIKDYLLGFGVNEFVWWESGTHFDCLPKNPFAFGHTIVLTTMAKGIATAFVSFFGSLNFGVALGTVDNAKDETVVVFIDPQAERAPHDLQSTRHAGVHIDIVRPEPLNAQLMATIKEGTGQTILQDLFGRIEEWKFGKEMAPVLERLNATRGASAADQKTAVQTIVHEEASRIHRIMRHLADRFETANKGKAGPEGAIVAVLKAMIAVNPPPRPTFNGDGERVMIGSLEAFTSDLCARLAQGAVDMEYLWGLFSGGYGAGIVGKIMFATAAERFPP